MNFLISKKEDQRFKKKCKRRQDRLLFVPFVLFILLYTLLQFLGMLLLQQLKKKQFFINQTAVKKNKINFQKYSDYLYHEKTCLLKLEISFEETTCLCHYSMHVTNYPLQHNIFKAQKSLIINSHFAQIFFMLFFLH